MSKDSVDIDQLIDIYKAMDDSDLSDEINNLSNYLYAILIASDSKSVEVLFGMEEILKIEILENKSCLH